MLEYCGIAFADNTHDDLPVTAAEAAGLFRHESSSYDAFENNLTSRLPFWRAKELRNYLSGFAGRPSGAYNGWIVVETPSRRIALLAKLGTDCRPKEALFGFPTTSKYRHTHLFFPVVVVDDSAPCKRAGYVWPCCHATLKQSERESAEVARCISAMKTHKL